MNNIYDEINSVIMESSLCVLNSIINLIDKNEYINEYSENEEFSDIFTESMMVLFMESFSKDKDEITKWLYNNGYFYSGDNPKKKKEFNRLYQLLKQHKFDPKTETYESDIDDGKGGKKRIKLNIDKFIGSASVEKKNSVLRGDNAFYSRSRNDITVGSNLLKRKQPISQFVLKHEEGHANSRVVNKGEKYSNYGNAVRDFIEDYKGDWDNEKFVNPHDDSVEELKADEYATKHTKIRTKDVGKQGKRATRDINMRDLIKIYMVMSNSLLKAGKDAARHLRDRKKDYEEKIDDLKEKEKRISQMKGNVSESDIKYILDICSNKNNGIYYYTTPEVEIAEIINIIVKYREDISKCKSEIDDIERKMDQEDDLLERLSSEIKIDGLRDVINTSTKHIESYMNDLRKNIDSMKKKHVTINADMIKGLRGKNLADEKVQLSIDQLIEKLKEHINDGISSYSKYIESTEKSIKQIKLVNDEGMEFSTALRYLYSKQFVKEYFEELAEDYFFYN